jgi:hypothetical protein
MRRPVEDRVGPSVSRHVHRVASPYVKPESNDPPPRGRAWSEQHWSALEAYAARNSQADPVECPIGARRQGLSQDRIEVVAQPTGAQAFGLA